MIEYIKKESVIEKINYLCEVCSEPPMDRADEIRLDLLRKLEKDFNELQTIKAMDEIDTNGILSQYEADLSEIKHGY